MEKPVSLKPVHIRDEKVKVLQSVIPIKDEEVVLGQYEGYKDDPTVSNKFNTRTFATVVLHIHNERWEGWRGFSVSHRLVDGDAVVFHLVEATTFKVYILRASSLSCVEGDTVQTKQQNISYRKKVKWQQQQAYQSSKTTTRRSSTSVGTEKPSASEDSCKSGNHDIHQNTDHKGVPFILKAGKALNSRKAEIRVQFKDVPGIIFRGQKQGRNEFVIRLQPSEAMYMKLTVKKPGLEMSPIQSEMDLSYGLRYQDVTIPEAYERLILDTVRGDQQHFVRRDELKAAWEVFTPLLHKIDRGELQTIPYSAGSRGPAEADELLARTVYVQTHDYIWIPPTL